MSNTSTALVNTPVTQDSNNNYTFTIDSAADCFCFYAFSSPPATITQKGTQDPHTGVQLINSQDEVTPDGNADYGYLYANDINALNCFQSTTGYIGFSVPINNDHTNGLTGYWTGICGYSGQNMPELKCTQRITQYGAINDYVLNVNLVLYSSDKLLVGKKRLIKNARALIYKIFSQVPITCEFSSITCYPLPDAPITDDFNDAQTAAIVEKNAKDDALTVIFVENLQVHLSNEIGRAGGIPGPQGFTNNYAATLIKLTNDPNDPFVTNDGLLGVTVAHEMGHYLGLTHESSDGRPENLMNTKANPANQKLNLTQRFILSHMPIVQIQYGDRELSAVTPVTQLELAVTTGTRTFPGGTDQNGNMILTFSLGSDADGYQSWDLSSNDAGNYLQPGTTTVFQLQDMENLYMEDLYTWGINCNWANETLYPMNFLAVTNYWDVAHIKITANGIVVEDADINMILSWLGQANFRKNI